MIWLLLQPLLPPVSKMTGDTPEDGERKTNADGRGGDRREAKAFDGEKAWSSLDHSILSVVKSIYIFCGPKI
jgi:hypothetical protein